MNLGFIGIGKIASAVIRGLCTSSAKYGIYLSPRNEENSSALAAQFESVVRLPNNQAVVDAADIIFIAVPPAQAESIIRELIFTSRHTAVSFIPFLSIEGLRHIASSAGRHMRACPLPAAEFHECPILVHQPDNRVLDVLQHIGSPLIIDDEHELHVLWTLTGLIAPFYDLSETLSTWAQSNGARASQYLMDMFSALTLSSRKGAVYDFAELKADATTPGGMNFQALNILKMQQAHQQYRVAADVLMKRFGK